MARKAYSGAHKETAELLRRCESLGASVTYNGHYRVKCPSGAMVVVPGSPSDGKRNFLNTRAQLRRAGMAV